MNTLRGVELTLLEHALHLAVGGEEIEAHLQDLKMQTASWASQDFQKVNQNHQISEGRGPRIRSGFWVDHGSEEGGDRAIPIVRYISAQ